MSDAPDKKPGCDLVAIDVDGTLIGADQRVPPETVQAVAAARAAGVAVCLATGRSYAETMPVWRQLDLRPPFEPMVLVGGAMVSEPDTGRTLYHKPIDRELTFEFADALADHGYSAMVLVDAWRWGIDYWFAEGTDAERAARDWFGQMDVKYRRVRRLRDAAGLRDPLRVSAVAEPDDAVELADALKRQFDGRLNVHPIRAPNYDITIVEGFAAGASKWTGVRYVAQGFRIPPARIAAVGDDVNDLAMLRSAGLGVAAANATDAAVAAADLTAEQGLAHFLRDLAAGKV